MAKYRRSCSRGQAEAAIAISKQGLCRVTSEMVWWDILYSEDRVPASSGDQAQFD